MGYTGYTVTRPRSVLVIIGGVIAWLGMVSGVLVTTPQYHLAMTMKEEPVEMTWQELVENGLTDNSHVKLIDVALDEPTKPDGFFEEMLEFDPEQPVEEQQQAFEDFAASVDFGEMIDVVMQPLKVYPAGQDPEDFPARIVVPQATWATDVAVDEINSSGTLTGRFTIGDGTDLHTRMAKALIAAAMAAESEQQPEAASETGEADPQIVQQDEAVADPDGSAESLKYVFEPVGGIPSLSEAQQWFWLSGLAMTIGLVICGAGGPSIICCFFFQVPSILSIFGYPLRYGRGTNATRVIYTVIGLGLISFGYQMMIVDARFGQIDGNIMAAAIAFLPTFFGAAAVLGAGTNMLADRLNISLDPTSTKKQVAPTISMSQACSLEPAEEDLAIPYLDRHLVASDEPLCEAMQQAAQSLASVGFDSPQEVVCQDGLETQPVLIQLGCQEMVVADIEMVDGQLSTRLISVLQDGITIITLSANFPAGKEKRFGTCGLYLQSDSNDPLEMLSAHLEETIGMAEKRDTTVITIDPSETVDVTALARRVLSDVRSQYGEEIVEVDPASYGRFSFPPQSVPTHAAV